MSYSLPQRGKKNWKYTGQDMVYQASLPRKVHKTSQKLNFQHPKTGKSLKRLTTLFRNNKP
jgi:hypothetical protein